MTPDTSDTTICLDSQRGVGIMNAIMAKRKLKPDPGEGKGRPISYRPSKSVEEAMEIYRAEQVFPPDKSAVIERAMRQFFEAEGFVFPEESGA